MARKQHRSVFWIVSTHVLTAGLTLPGFVGAIGYGIARQAELGPVAAWLTILAFQALGYLGGDHYSLSYLRKVAIIKNPEACIQAAIVSFSLIALLGFSINLAIILLGKGPSVGPVIAVISLTAFYGFVWYSFARTTRAGFLALATESIET